MSNKNSIAIAPPPCRDVRKDVLAHSPPTSASTPPTFPLSGVVEAIETPDADCEHDDVFPDLSGTETRAVAEDRIALQIGIDDSLAEATHN
jgi:hypothetical protein